MKTVLALLVLLCAAPAFSTSFETGGCASGGCDTSDQWLHSNANELDEAIDALDALNREFHASAYATDSDTAGIQEAVDAACAAFPTTPYGGKVVIPYGNVTTSATVTIDCERITLEGYGLGSRILPPAGSAAILVTEDRVTLRDFVLDFTVSNAGNIGINLDSGVAGPSNVKIDGLVIDGASMSGIGVRCDGCLKSSIVNTNIRDWGQGSYWTGTAGTSYPNANSILASTISSNANEAVRINDLHSAFTITGSTFESNGTGVSCDSVAGGKSSLLSTGNHYENSSVAAIYRPDLGCAMNSIGDRFSDSNTKDYISIDTTNDQPSYFIGTQFGTSGITNASGYALRVVNPLDLNGLSCGAETDACTLSIGAVTATTPTAGDNDTSVATTEFVQDELSSANVVLAADIGSTVQAYDADLADLADGSLPGSKIGSGLDASVITAGTIASTARLPSSVIEESEMTAANINSLTTDDDFVTTSGTHTLNITGSAAFTGTLAGRVGVSTVSGTSSTLIADDMLGTMIVCTNASGCDITLPAASAGVNGCFRDSNGGGMVVLDAAAGDEIELDGVGVGTADAIDSAGAKGDFICLLALDSTTWITLGRSGTWVDGGAD